MTDPVCMPEQPDKAETPITDASSWHDYTANSSYRNVEEIVKATVARYLERKLAAADQRAEQAERERDALDEAYKGLFDEHEQAEQRAEEMRRENGSLMRERESARAVVWEVRRILGRDHAVEGATLLMARLRAVEAALAELVYLEDDLSPRIQKGATMMACIDAQHEYWRRAPLAWESARQALSTPQEEKS